MQEFMAIQAAEIKWLLRAEPKQDVYILSSKVQGPLLKKGWEIHTSCYGERLKIAIL